MGIEITLDSTVKELEKDLIRLSQIEITKITNQAVNKTLTSTRVQASRMLRAKINLKAGLFKNKYTKIFKAQRGTLHGHVELSNKPLSLINFKRGKSIASQKGKSYKQRPKLNISYRKGKKTNLKGAFLAKGKNGNVHIFKRAKGSKSYIKSQAAPSISETFLATAMIKPIQHFAQFRIKKEFGVALNFQLNKLSRRSRAWA